MKWRWSGVVFAIWASLLPVLAIVVSAPEARAAVPVDINATYRFVDANSIETTDGNLFFGNNPGNDCVGRSCQAPTRTWRLNLTNDKDGCQDYLTVTYATATKRITGMVYTYSTPSNDTTQSRCTPAANRNILTLNKFDAASMQWYDAVYEWRNVNLIENIETKATYARNTTGATDTFTEVGKTQCASTLTNVRSTQATFTARSVNGASCNVAAARTVDIARPNNMNIPAGSNVPTPPASDGDGDTTDPVTCDAGSVLTWLVCSVIESSLTVIDFIRDEFILPVLEVPPLTSRDETLFKVWENMRNLASLFFILLFLLTIFGTAIGYDNYTIKKVLPRIVTGAVLLPLSWPLSAAFIDLGNIFGQGLITLLEPIINAGGPPNIDFTSNMTDLFLGAGGTAVGIGILAAAVGSSAVGAITGLGLATVLTFLFSILAAFMTIVFRQLLIVMLVVLSPIALAAWILPNTQSFTKMWMKNYFRVIMMYPLFVLLMESGRLAAKVAEGIAPTGDPTSIVATVVVPYIQIVCLAGALIALPLTIKWPGGIFAAGVSGINKAKGWGNKQVGRGSNFDKDRQRVREYKSLLRAKKFGGKAAKAEEDGNRFQAFRFRAAAAANRARSGKGGKGIMGAGGLRAGNDLERSEFEGAQSTAYKTAGQALGSEWLNKNVPGESLDDRVKAEALAFYEEKTKTRATRAGAVDAADEVGVENLGTNLYKRTREDTRKDKVVSASRDEAAVGEYARARPTTGQLRGFGIGEQQKAMAEEFGKIQGTARAEGELDVEMQIKAEMNRLTASGAMAGRTEADIRAMATANVGDFRRQIAAERSRLRASGAANGMSVEQLNQIAERNVLARGGHSIVSAEEARGMRQNRLQQASAGAARSAAGTKEGETQETFEYSRDQGRLSMSTITRASALETRDNIAKKRAAAESRVAVQDTDLGNLSRRDVAHEAYEEAEEHAGEAAATRKQNLTDRLEQERIARITGDPTLAPSLRNKMIAAQSKAQAKNAEENASTTAAVRAMEGWAGTGGFSTAANYQQQFTTKLQAAEKARSKSDKIAEQTTQLIEEQENRVMEAAGVTDPSAAPMVVRQRAHAEMMKFVGEKAGSDEKGNLREEFNKAVGEVEGEELGARNTQIQMEADYLRQVNPRLTPEAALAQARARVAAGPSATKVKIEDAVKNYRDSKAASTRLSAAQAASAATGTAIAKDRAQQAAIGEAMVDAEIAAAAAAGTTLTRDAARAQVAARRTAEEALVAAGGRAGSDARIRLQAEQQNATETVIESASNAAYDQSRRSEATAQGTLRAQNTAYNSPTKPTEEQLITISQRGEESSQASREAEAAAKVLQPEKSYSEQVESAQRLATETLLQQRVNEASRGVVERTVVDPKDKTKTRRVKVKFRRDNVELSPVNREALKEEAIDAFNQRDFARFIATTRSLSRSGGGTEIIREVMEQTMGRNYFNNVDDGVAATVKADMERLYGDKDFDLKAIYDQAVSAVGPSRPDLRVPASVGFDELSADEYMKLDRRSKRHYASLVQEIKTSPDPRVRGEFEEKKSAMITNIIDGLGNAQTRKFARNIDYEEMYKFIYGKYNPTTHDWEVNIDPVSKNPIPNPDFYPQLVSTAEGKRALKYIEEGHQRFASGTP